MRDELVFWERIEQHRSVLSRYISAVVTDTGLSEEIIQDVCLIAWLKYDSFIFSPNPGGWLMNTAKYTISNALRKKDRALLEMLPLDEIILVINNNDETFSDVFGMDILKDCQKLLSPNDYYTVIAVSVLGYTCKEVAAKLNIGSGTCQKRYQRAISKLRASSIIQAHLYS